MHAGDARGDFGEQMKTSSEKALAGWTEVTVKVRGQCKPPEETHAGDHGCNHRRRGRGREELEKSPQQTSSESELR